VLDQFLQVQEKILLLNDSIISPVGSELKNTEDAIARPRGSLEEEILFTKEKQI
jgi:hypothetical protein